MNRQLAALKNVNGVWFNNKHSWRDYHMLLSERIVIGDAVPRLILIDVPGADGLLDATEAVSGSVIRYKNRVLSFVFVAEVPAEKQVEFVSGILNELHGAEVTVELDEDAGWLYEGRATVTPENLDRDRIKVKIEVDAFPYKKAKRWTERTFAVDTNPQTTDVDIIPTTKTVEGETTTFRFTRGAGNFSLYSAIKFAFSQSVQEFVGSVTDKFGLSSFFGGGSQSAISEYLLDMSQFTGLDWSNIAEIVISVNANVTLYGVFSGQAIVVQNGKMETIPTFSTQDVTSMQVICNGKTTTLPPTLLSQSDDVTLAPFRNVLGLKNVTTSGQNPTLTIRYQEGLL